MRRRTGAELPAPDYAALPPQVDEHSKAKVSDLFRGSTRNAMIAVGSLWTIGVLAYYGFSSLAPVLLVDKGYDITKSLFYTAAMAVGYPLGALTAAIVAEKLERRTLAVSTALATAAAGLVFGYGTGDAIIMAAGFATGFASNVHSSCTNMYASEVFPTRLRSTAIGLCYGSGRLFALLMPFLGLTILDAFGGSTVLLLSAVLFVITAASYGYSAPRPPADPSKTSPSTSPANVEFLVCEPRVHVAHRRQFVLSWRSRAPKRENTTLTHSLR